MSGSHILPLGLTTGVVNQVSTSPATLFIEEGINGTDFLDFGFLLSVQKACNGMAAHEQHSYRYQEIYFIIFILRG
jgi:hypothetical protein